VCFDLLLVFQSFFGSRAYPASVCCVGFAYIIDTLVQASFAASVLCAACGFVFAVCVCVEARQCSCWAGKSRFLLDSERQHHEMAFFLLVALSSRPSPPITEIAHSMALGRTRTYSVFVCRSPCSDCRGHFRLGRHTVGAKAQHPMRWLCADATQRVAPVAQRAPRPRPTST